MSSKMREIEKVYAKARAGGGAKKTGKGGKAAGMKSTAQGWRGWQGMQPRGVAGVHMQGCRPLCICTLLCLFEARACKASRNQHQKKFHCRDRER
jgi:hypothetical protein